MSLSEKEKDIIDRLDQLTGFQMMSLLVNPSDKEEVTRVSQQLDAVVRVLTDKPIIAMGAMQVWVRANMVSGLAEQDDDYIEEYFDQIKECSACGKPGCIPEDHEQDDGAD